jgi:large subunit ribosomal protein L15
MPLVRRLPKFGFANPFRVEYAVVNLKSLAGLQSRETVTPAVLHDAGLIKRKHLPVKVLGMGELTRPLVIQAHKFSKSAEAKIQAAGGRAEVISGV